MAKTFQDLEREVEELKQQLLQLTGASTAEADGTREELLSNEPTDDDRQGGRRDGESGWSKVAGEACEKARLSGERTRRLLRGMSGG